MDVRPFSNPLTTIFIHQRTNERYPFNTRVSLTRWKGQEAREIFALRKREREREKTFHFWISRVRGSSIEIPLVRFLFLPSVFHAKSEPSYALDLVAADRSAYSIRLECTVRLEAVSFPFLRR